MFSVLNSLPHADGHPASLRPALPHHGARTSSLQCRLFDRILSLHRQVLPPLLRRAHRLHHAQARRRASPNPQPAHLRSPRTPHVHHQPRPPAQSRNLRLPRIRLQRTGGADISRVVRGETGAPARPKPVCRCGAGRPARPSRAQLGRLWLAPPHSSTSHPSCAAVSGTTLNRPCRTSGDFANAARALISDSVFGFAIAFPTLIFTCGFLGSLASTATTDAVPTALFSSPVW